ncbi:MAG: hypothetical protein IKW74_07715, partial [Thermoguttaceae bacterium]|nr:hypothetical protein [Thermoguttaceae bacterium]
APLFYNVNYSKWPINLIGFDNARNYAIPSYYVEKMLNDHRGDTVLTTTLANVPRSDGLDELTALAHFDSRSGEYILRVVNFADAPYEVNVEINGANIAAQDAWGVVLTSDRDTDENSIDQPNNVVPKEIRISVPGSSFKMTVEKFSLTVLRLKKENPAQ